MDTIHLCWFLILVTTIASPSTRCVWDSVDEFDHLNGEYIEEGTWYNGKNTYSYWKRDSSSCPDTQQVIYASYYSADKMSYWTINPTLENDVVNVPDCGNDDKNMASDPSQCSKGWTVWENDKDFSNIPLQVSDGLCPSLPCVRIQVTNSGVSACNQIFSKDSSKEHVYYSNGQGTTTYLFFNLYTFKWHCSNTLDQTYCGDDSGINAILSSKLDGWDNVQLNAQFTLQMDNDWTATFQCLEGTLPPTQRTKRPTESPTLGPTPAPTDDPTKKPTTPHPTPPGTMMCGETGVGDYNGVALSFMVSIPAIGDLTFDASASLFTITVMEATTELNTLLATDLDGDNVIVIPNTPPGNYRFTIYGGTQTNVIYAVHTSCTTHDPTPAPTSVPSPAPTSAPTDQPTPSPTDDPTPLPTFDPTTDPTNDPTSVPTIPTFVPSVPPTKPPTGFPSIPPTKFPTIETTEGDAEFITPRGTDGDALTAILAVLISVTVVVCIVVLIMWYRYYLKQEEAKRNKMMKPKDEMKDTGANIGHLNVVSLSSDNVGESADNIGEYEPGFKPNIEMKQAPAKRIQEMNDMADKVLKQEVPMVAPILETPAGAASDDDDEDTSSSSMDDFFDAGAKGQTGGIGPQDSMRKDRMMDANAMSDLFGEGDNDAETGNKGRESYGACADCMETNMGRFYDGDGLFYCYACWNAYEELPASAM